jgi:hypothetical protein
MDDKPMRFSSLDGDPDHVEERLREIRLPQPLAGMDEEPTDALIGHFLNLPSDLRFCQFAVPEPEGVEPVSDSPAFCDLWHT